MSTTDVIVGLVAFFVSAGAYAYAEDLRDYRCKIDRATTADPLETDIQGELAKYYVGKEFTVDRKSGVMAGALKNYYVTPPKVIDFGSSQNSFKVIATMRLDQGAGRGSDVYTLVVKQYSEGPRKPFVFLENDYLYFGTCTHF